MQNLLSYEEQRYTTRSPTQAQHFFPWIIRPAASRGDDMLNSDWRQKPLLLPLTLIVINTINKTLVLSIRRFFVNVSTLLHDDTLLVQVFDSDSHGDGYLTLIVVDANKILVLSRLPWLSG